MCRFVCLPTGTNKADTLVVWYVLDHSCHCIFLKFPLCKTWSGCMTCGTYHSDYYHYNSSGLMPLFGGMLIHVQCTLIVHLTRTRSSMWPSLSTPLHTTASPHPPTPHTCTHTGTLGRQVWACPDKACVHEFVCSMQAMFFISTGKSLHLAFSHLTAEVYVISSSYDTSSIQYSTSCYLLHLHSSLSLSLCVLFLFCYFLK